MAIIQAMKSDIDALMQEQGVDVLLITGAGDHNPAMIYLTGGAHLTNADVIKVRGQPPVLFHADMERDEARRTGLETRNQAVYKTEKLQQQSGGNFLQATITRYQQMFEDLGIHSGRVALYGRIDAGAALSIFSGLGKVLPGLCFVAELGNTLLMQAMAKKDPGEVERIRKMGEITVDVVAEVADLLTSHAVKDGILVKPDGAPLFVGEVKRRIDRWLLDRGAENPAGTIFALGYDAAVPHSSGSDGDLIRLGETLIFDIFPCERGGGYYHDFTRTWCLGYAPDDVYSLYEDVLNVFHSVLSTLQPGMKTSQPMQLACELFEQCGHPTSRSSPLTQDGFVHGLGHSLGLNIHERPYFELSASETDCLEPGLVMTVEPGLYYPKRGMGVRLEDTVWMRPDGIPEVLVDYPMDLVLPVRVG